ncbi:MAG: hypothetical protein HYV61_08070 [Candidatus Rokubacteria bacterium]|nr:hypothetical protein [Candidatus Rokubacteria bacterium]
MVPLRVVIGWTVSALLLFLSSTLLFCFALQGILQPDHCRRLQGLFWSAARPLLNLFGL